MWCCGVVWCGVGDRVGNECVRGCVVYMWKGVGGCIKRIVDKELRVTYPAVEYSR